MEEKPNRRQSGFRNNATDLLTTMANRLRHFREHVGRSQVEMASALDTPQNFIHRVEYDCKVSLPGFMAYLDFLEKEHNLNRSWVLNAENKGTPMFMTTVDKRKKAQADKKAEAYEEVRKFIRKMIPLVELDEQLAQAINLEATIGRTTKSVIDKEVEEPAADDERVIHALNELGTDNTGTIRKPRRGRQTTRKS